MSSNLSIIQTNLQHSKTATTTLRIVLETNNETITLIQEPTEYVTSTTSQDKYNTVPTDLTTIRILSNPYSEGPDMVLVYLPGDEDTPTPELEAFVVYCERERLELIVSMDSNAHHMLWGSQDTNTRDQLNFFCGKK